MFEQEITHNETVLQENDFIVVVDAPEPNVEPMHTTKKDATKSYVSTVPYYYEMTQEEWERSQGYQS